MMLSKYIYLHLVGVRHQEWTGSIQIYQFIEYKKTYLYTKTRTKITDIIQKALRKATSVYNVIWRHNERDGVSNHRRLDCLHNRLFRRRSKKTSKLRVTGLRQSPFWWGIHRWPVNSPHQGQVTWKMFPFDDVIMNDSWYIVNWTLRNKLQWFFNRNSNIFIQENAFRNIVWKTAAILSRPQYVKCLTAYNQELTLSKVHVAL